MCIMSVGKCEAVDLPSCGFFYMYVNSHVTHIYGTSGIVTLIHCI